MKKETLLEIILGTIGGLIFAIGMCMCLIPEWHLFHAGIIVGIIGFVVLLPIISIYLKAHPLSSKSMDAKMILLWGIGIGGALLMGFGMSRVMASNPTAMEMMIGLICGVIGLLICILEYPLYTYFHKK